MKEDYSIDHTSKKWLWSVLNTEEEVNEVIDYLFKNNLKIEMRPYGDGCKMYLEGIDLSGNGYCFKAQNLLNHVRYFRKLQELSKTKDFEIWNEKYEHYNIVRRYIIEHDQRWIDTERLDALLKYSSNV